MNHLIIRQHTVSLFLLLLLEFISLLMCGDDDHVLVKAQTLSDNTEPTQPQVSSSLTNNFQPSLAVVIGMLAVMFSLTFVLLLYAKFCHRASSSSSSHRRMDQNGVARTRSTPSLASGVEKTVIESLPFFRFSSLRGLKEGLECSVCLARFLDVEVLRLLPKCKHAFHAGCIDQWLEKHSTCPLCRRRVSADDLSLQLPCSGSFRFLFDELHVEREASRRHGSFRDDELPIQQISDDGHHKFNHRINCVLSDSVVLRNRWSDVTPADLVFLNSELLSHVSSARFSESKLLESSSSSSGPKQGGFESKDLNTCSDKRSMSEIIHHPRLLITELRSDDRNSAKEERIRKLWLPIARKTAHCFASRQLVRPPQ